MRPSSPVSTEESAVLNASWVSGQWSWRSRDDKSRSLPWKAQAPEAPPPPAVSRGAGRGPGQSLTVWQGGTCSVKVIASKQCRTALGGPSSRLSALTPKCLSFPPLPVGRERSVLLAVQW